MKSIAVWILLLWISLVMEQSRADLLPSGSLLFPIGVGCLFWFRSGTGVVLAGFGFILHWLLLQTRAPLDGAGMLLMSAVLLTRRQSWFYDSTKTPAGSRHAWWLQPLLVVLIGVLIHVFLMTADRSPHRVEAAMAGQRLGVAVCATLALSLAARIADELGLRRRTEVF